MGKLEGGGSDLCFDASTYVEGGHLGGQAGPGSWGVRGKSFLTSLSKRLFRRSDVVDAVGVAGQPGHVS